MQDVELVKAALLRASDVAMQFYRADVKKKQKPDGSLVTAGDLAINEALHDMLTAARPDYGWLSEEGPDDPNRLSRQRCWILDPIDGTRSFAELREEWCIGLCLCENGKPIVCGVIQPTKRLLYLAEAGKGATCNGAPLHMSDAANLNHARLAARALARQKLEGSGVDPVNVSYTPQITRLAMLAGSEVDIVLSFGPKHDWDIAPGALLVTEAGGKISDEQGRSMIFGQPDPKQNGLVAAGTARHAAVMTYLERT